MISSLSVAKTDPERGRIGVDTVEDRGDRIMGQDLTDAITHSCSLGIYFCLHMSTSNRCSGYVTGWFLKRSIAKQMKAMERYSNEKINSYQLMSVNR